MGFASAGVFGQRTRQCVAHACRRQANVRASRGALVGLRAQVDPRDAPVEPATDGGIDWSAVQQQFVLFRKMALPYFQEEKSARTLLAIVIAFTLLNSSVSVGFSYLSRDFWSALNAKDTDAFYPTLGKYAIALAGGTPVAVLYKFYRDKLSVQWRSWMTQRVLDMYEANRAYYEVEMKGAIDNPDQRIAEDARAFTSVSLAFSITLLTSVIDLVSFSGILYSIYPQLFVAIIGYSSFGTGMTLWIGKTLVQKNAKQLKTEADFRFSLVRMRENAESIAFYGGEALEMREIKARLAKTVDNYYSLIGTSRNLELFTTAYSYMVQVIPAWVVAPLYFSGKIQLGVVSQSYGAFNHILGDLSIIVNQFESISSFGAGIGRLGTFIEELEARQRISAQSEQGSLSSSYSSSSSTSSSSPVVTSWDRVTWWQAVSTAVSLQGVDKSDPTPFGDVLAKAARELVPILPITSGGDTTLDTPIASSLLALTPGIDTGGGVGGSMITSEVVASGGDAVLEIEGLTLKTPDGARVLCTDLSIRIRKAQHVLIVGESGAGKSSLLRAIAGLWTTGAGHIKRPSPSETFFLPQRPYCTLGTLREQLLYPIRPDDSSRPQPSDRELLDLLDQVKLPDLASRLKEADGGNGLESVRDWSAMLSLGEQQRLGFARLLLNNPTLAILDEASSALDLVSEKAMYELLEQRTSLTYISVGHRPSLVDYHDSKLRLKLQGFQLEPISKDSQSAPLAQSQTSL
eukprot:CAMPEP_0179421420 /NCGR_PEP_ID=MMETSP0799-20121207/9767_1 /TAXON_ID=46947 /ORGANISM="Geminigera cryophila, Strain CCMP2564" /LENGTH=743 /DNA_ID=CAMNT_0021195247 /DNA_START=131 /DNA_END=2362 /DNA_ORIENTATION=-